MQRLTRRAEQILEWAKEAAAKENDHAFMGTEHLLLAILREGSGVGAQLLREQGITQARVRGELGRVRCSSLDETLVIGGLAGTPDLMDVLSRAVRVARGTARGTGNWQIGSIHLLVGLLGARESTAYKVLRALGVTGATFREALARAVSERSGAARPPTAGIRVTGCRESAA